jgi:hypothetical protein
MIGLIITLELEFFLLARVFTIPANDFQKGV